MSQNAQNAGQVLQMRANPYPPVSATAPVPLRRPEIARRWRVTSALMWLFRFLFVTPVGPRARAERLGALSDRALRDIGLMRRDIGAASSGMVPLDVAVRAYPRAGPLVVSDRCGRPLTLIRLNRAA